MALSFDELNKLYDGKRSMPYEKYFGEMELPQEEKQKRIELAEDLEYVMIWLLSGLYAEYRANREADINFYAEGAKMRYMEVLEEHNIDIDDTITVHVDEAVDSIVLTTIRNVPIKILPEQKELYDVEEPNKTSTPQKKGIKGTKGTKGDTNPTANPSDDTDEKKTDLWYVSPDRAKLDAEEESNTASNHKDFIKALKSGKTKKQWITKRDDRVRKTHKPIDGTVIGIKDFFNVGGYAMLYPRDRKTGGAPMSEISMCRCVVEYF